VLAGAPLHRIFLLRIAQLREVRVTEDRVGVDVDLGIQRDEMARLGDDQRIDLDQAGVLLDVEPVESARDRLELGDLPPP
jgi:hypothetical protein